MEIDITHLRKLAVSIKAKHKLYYDLVIPFLGIHPKVRNTCVTEACTGMFKAAFLVTVENCNNAFFRNNKPQYIYTVKHQSAN